MGQYLVNFAAYTLAMVGLICLCMLVYKKSFLDAGNNSKVDFLKVENRLNLSARKTIYVIKAGEERFLVASDVDKTTFLAKLGEEQQVQQVSSIEKFHSVSKKPTLAGVSVGDELSESNSNVRKLPVMRELMKKLNSQRG